MTTAKIIYGTAWKKERTTALVIAAMTNGFRAIDTACQLKHYREDLVGEALEVLGREHGITREQLYLQTKFTPIDGQDRSQFVPYDPSAPIPDQITSSVSKSLSNLRTNYLDAYLLHSPLREVKHTVSAWRTLVNLRTEGKVRKIGISNAYDVRLLHALEEASGAPVEIVQNRWYEGNDWDADVRRYCVERGIQYQSFWTLTGSPSLLRHSHLTALASQMRCTPAQAVYRLAQHLGVTPLCGSTDLKHMREALSVETLDMNKGQESDEVQELMTILSH